MRAAPVSQSAREPVASLVAASRAACLRTCGLGLVLPLGIVLLGGGWQMALVALCSALLALVIERALSRSPAAHMPGGAVRVPAAASAAASDQPTPDRFCEQARTMLEALGEGVLVVDRLGCIVAANPAAAKILRHPLQDPTGMVLWEALSPDLARLAQDAWRAVLDRSQVTADELPQVRYSGVPCRDHVYDLTAVDATSARTGRHHGVLFLFVDSTRSHELQRLKDRFLSSVSHELRTPLTNVCAYAEILRTMPLGEDREWAEFVRVIHEEGLHLSQLVDGMFDYLQLESGEAVFCSEEVDGAATVRELLGSLRAVATARRIELRFDERGDAPMLVADQGRLRHVVRSLVDNSLKFTPPGGQVTVTVGARDEAWELRIEDSGPGVPADDRRAVFDKFHQLHDHLTDKPSGAGLGLATSRAIVGRLGGLIWCEEAPLGGAAFVVRLPGYGQPRLASTAGAGAGGGF